MKGIMNYLSFLREKHAVVFWAMLVTLALMTTGTAAAVKGTMSPSGEEVVVTEPVVTDTPPATVPTATQPTIDVDALVKKMSEANALLLMQHAEQQNKILTTALKSLATKAEVEELRQQVSQLSGEVETLKKAKKKKSEKTNNNQNLWY